MHSIRFDLCWEGDRKNDRWYFKQACELFAGENCFEGASVETAETGEFVQESHHQRTEEKFEVICFVSQLSHNTFEKVPRKIFRLSVSSRFQYSLFLLHKTNLLVYYFYKQ